MKLFIKEYLKLLRFIKPYWYILALAALCMGVSTLFEGVSLGMIVPLSDRVLTNKEIIIPGQLPQFIANFIAKINALEPAVLLKNMVVFLVILFFLKGIFLFLQNYLMNVAGQMGVRQVRNKLYAKFHELSLNFYSQRRTGELMSRITNDVGIITNAISYGLTDLIYQSMQLVFFAFVAFSLGFKISWKLPLFAFVIFPLIMLPVVRVGKKIKKFSIEVQKKMADLNSLLSETIQGAYIVKAFCRENYELDRFKEINRNFYRFTLKSAKRTIMLSPFTEFIGASGAVIILWFIGREVIAGRLSFGIFGLFLATLLSMIRPLKKLSNVYSINQQAFAASNRIYEILEQEPQIKEVQNPYQISDLKEEVKFDDVSFSYEPGGDVLKDISVTVKKGEVIALVGPSGAGKSTLVSLLPRFYDPYQGKISIDGVDLRDMSLKSLRSLISVVSQEMVLFNTTVGENIAYGKDGAMEHEIIEAAKKAFVYDFAMRLPKAFDTVIGDRGFRLSGGEKQRISIARAFLKDSPILILDEATSHLDSESERLIQKALSELMKGKTVFVIAHRLSTVQHADKILVLDKGRVIEQGNHDYLIKNSKVYKRLYELQFNV